MSHFDTQMMAITALLLLMGAVIYNNYCYLTIISATTKSPGNIYRD